MLTLDAPELVAGGLYFRDAEHAHQWWRMPGVARVVEGVAPLPLSLWLMRHDDAAASDAEDPSFRGLGVVQALVDVAPPPSAEAEVALRTRSDTPLDVSAAPITRGQCWLAWGGHLVPSSAHPLRAGSSRPIAPLSLELDVAGATLLRAASNDGQSILGATCELWFHATHSGPDVVATLGGDPHTPGAPLELSATGGSPAEVTAALEALVACGFLRVEHSNGRGPLPVHEWPPTVIAALAGRLWRPSPTSKWVGYGVPGIISLPELAPLPGFLGEEKIEFCSGAPVEVPFYSGGPLRPVPPDAIYEVRLEGPRVAEFRLRPLGLGDGGELEQVVIDVDVPSLGQRRFVLERKAGHREASWAMPLPMGAEVEPWRYRASAVTAGGATVELPWAEAGATRLVVLAFPEAPSPKPNGGSAAISAKASRALGPEARAVAEHPHEHAGAVTLLIGLSGPAGLAAREALTAAGARVRSLVGDVVTADAPPSALTAIAELDFVMSVEISRPLRPENPVR